MDNMNLAPPLTPYIYRPLRPPPSRTIRLLLLHPPSDNDNVCEGASDAPLVASLETHPLACAPPFDAISYVWDTGDTHTDSPAQSSSCNIAVGNKFAVPISQNLDWALRHARREQEQEQARGRAQPAAHRIWADAVCINQADDDERSAQVAFMGAIYAQAERVFVCMGNPPTPGADRAVMNLVQSVMRVLSNEDTDADGDDAIDAERDAWWAALREVLELPWFRRVWVIQEVGLARNPVVLYGHTSFRYRQLIATVEWSNTQKSLARHRLAPWRIHCEWEDWQQQSHEEDPEWKSEGPTFFDLLDDASLLSCRDPRDRVYAFLGHPLARGDPTSLGGTTRCRNGLDRPPIVIPDYTKDVNEVYTDVTKLCLGMVGLRALVAVEHDAQSLDDGAPSWVIRWHISNKPDNISLLPEPTFHAGGPPATADLVSFVPPIDGSRLTLQGTTADSLWKSFHIHFGFDEGTIHFTDADDHPTTTTTTQQKLDLHALLAILVRQDTPSAYSSNRYWATYRHPDHPLPLHMYKATLRAFAAVMCGGRPWELGVRSYLNGLLDFLRLVDGGAVRDCDDTGPANSDGSYDTALIFFRSMASVSAGRCFAITEQGRYCLVSHLARPGDQVCVLRGLDVPVIMRVVKGGGERRCRRILLEEAYVDRLMQGEAMGMMERGELVEEDFVVE
ncbi:heterokaryon incompatibility protein-domain-containing protein [Echria macrotheca]|uniref:Heterokaryon incompatibility protein-domain-containing protein n=1 Tax=Echria macrotheca TaxID=438768 RepID=A0AAJ0B779_9PEZI|nr:heterokaryon incompatibility protein-domain-containing protein [Echria macrotheca]